MIGKRKLFNISFIIFSMLLIVLCIFIAPENIYQELINAYYINMFSLIILLGSFIIILLKYPIDMFDPLPTTWFIYSMIFAICPIIDIKTNNTTIYGFNPMKSSVKATLIFLISYMFFLIGYLWKAKYRTLRGKKINSAKVKEAFNNRKIRVRNAFFLWMIGFAGTLIYLLGSGMSISYILSMGSSGDMDISSASSTPLGFIGMLTFTMITSCIYLLFFSTNIILKIVVYFITMSCLYVRGFRSLIIILILGPIIAYYIINKKRPKAITLLILFLLLCIMIGVVGYSRGAVRAGNDVNWENFNFNDIYDALLGNFRRYNIFYGMVEALPSEHNFTFGKNYLYTLTMMIPRAIWPGKPEPVMREILQVSTTDLIASTGAAWPNIGEYYMEFGVIGCIIFMYGLGRIFAWTKSKFIGKNATVDSIIGYSVFIPSLVTIIAYGYTPTTFYMMLFLLLPTVLVKYRVKLNP